MRIRIPVALTAAISLTVAACPARATFSPLDVATDALSGPALAGHSTGDASVAWVRTTDHAVVLRQVPATGPPGALRVISTIGDSATAAPPAAAATASGTLVAWVRASDQHLLVRAISPGGTLGPTWDVSGSSLSAGNGQAALAANANGDAAVAWRRPDTSHVSYRALSAATGPVAPAITVTSEPDAALYGTNVHVAIAPDGTGTVAWHRGTDCHILARRVSPGGVTLGPQLDLSGEPDSALGDTSPSVVADASGGVTAAWHRDSDQHVVARRWMPDGALEPLRDLSGGRRASPAGFGVASEAPGRLVAWQRGDDRHVITSAPDDPATTVDVSGEPSGPATAPAVAGMAGGSVVAWLNEGGQLRVARSVGVVDDTAPDDTPVPPPVGEAPSGARDAVVVLPARVVRRGRSLRITIRCRPQAACRGTVDVRLRGRRVGRARFAVPRGARRTITIRLARRALRQARLGLVVRLNGRHAQRRTVTVRTERRH